MSGREELVIDQEGGGAAVRWSAQGTNALPYLGAGPTGRLITITGIEIVRVRDGRIARRWGEWDVTAHTGG